MSPKMHLDVIIYRDGNDLVAHCLQLDLVVVAKTLKQAKQDILDVIASHLECARENNLMHKVYNPAPPEIWEMLAVTRKRTRMAKFPDIPIQRMVQEIDFNQIVSYG